MKNLKEKICNLSTGSINNDFACGITPHYLKWVDFVDWLNDILTEYGLFTNIDLYNCLTEHVDFNKKGKIITSLVKLTNPNNHFYNIEILWHKMPVKNWKIICYVY